MSKNASGSNSTFESGTLVLNEDEKYATMVIIPWARAVSRNSEYPNVEITTSEITFGRNADCTVKFPNNKAISGRHCRLYREKEKVYLEDLSTNGTFLNGEKIGKGNKVTMSSADEFALIPRGRGREKIGYVLYIHGDESAKEEKAPEGTVTFVFTDVQGSTRLWEQKPDQMDTALKNHDTLLRKLLKRYRGYEVKTEGDAFMVTFSSVLDAIRWCIAVQKALLDAEWPAELLTMPMAKKETDTDGNLLFNGIRIRMGIHVGEPNSRINPITQRMDYFGPVVNRCARVSDSAHGGQIVCTQEVIDALQKATKEGKLAEPVAPSSSSSTSATAPSSDTKESKSATDNTVDLTTVQTKDLGYYTLKGINNSIRIYQLYPPYLASRQFPPLRTGKKDDDPPKTNSTNTEPNKT